MGNSGFEPNLQIAEHGCVHARADEGLQVVQQVVLPRLAEGEAIDREAAFKPGKSRDFPTKRQHRHMPFNPDRTLVDPVGDEIGVDRCFRSRPLEHQLPRVVGSLTATPDDRSLAFRQIETYCVSLETMNAALALLQIHWIARKIPMIDAITIGMEVETFLTDGCRGENERPER